MCWLDEPQPDPERQQYVNSMLPRKRVPPPAWRWAGVVGESRINPSAWLMRGQPTLRQEERRVTFARMKNRDIYAALLSRLFSEDAESCAFPRAFERARRNLRGSLGVNGFDASAEEQIRAAWGERGKLRI